MQTNNKSKVVEPSEVVERSRNYKQTEVGVIPEDWEVETFKDFTKENKMSEQLIKTTLVAWDTLQSQIATCNKLSQILRQFKNDGSIKNETH